VVTGASALRVGLVFPELLGTYGDHGNAVVLVERCRRRGIDAELVEIAAGTAIPDSLDVYLFGGGEDDPQVMAAAGMRDSHDAIERAHSRGAVIFAVCAGFQLLGHSYEARGGERLAGLGLVDMATAAGPDRLIGEVVVEPDPSLHLPVLTGFENHGGRTRLGPAERPLGRVICGGGNGVDGVDGVLRERVVGTYLHGPVLPRNPALADLMLSWVVSSELAALDDHLIEELRAERLTAATATGWRARLRDFRLNRG
jgi:lipid II isoglutaminyl synthase (glutamine-hydrolysing)